MRLRKNRNSNKGSEGSEELVKELSKLQQRIKELEKENQALKQKTLK